MRISNARDLGFFVRQRRQDRGLTQSRLAAEAGVSLRWLAELEAGKATAEFGLVLRTLQALDIELDASPVASDPDNIGLDALIDDLGSDHA